MAFSNLLSLLLIYCFSVVTHAETLQINPSHPNQYTVVHGDTLWEISAKFLRNPGQWPDLWRSNTQIKNPHLIYPGDTIYFSMLNGTPQLSLSRPSLNTTTVANDGTCVLLEDDVKNGRSKFSVTKDGKLQSCIRESSLNQAIKLIPLDKISQFLNSPSVVGANDLNASPYVVALAGEHLIAGAGDKLYVRAITHTQPNTYTIYRAGNTYINPDTGEILGYEAKYIADASLLQPGDPATLMTVKSSSEIRTGDRLMPNAEAELTLNYFPRPPDKPIKGNIISVLEGVSQIGLYNVVVIDKGIRDGLAVGHQLDVYQKGAMALDNFSPVKNDLVKLPDEQAGIVMIFRVFNTVSYALVMKANQAIHLLDKVQSP
ncbi:MAG: LysM peptidoglycan-binding domain-containing protein [Methylovulum sp.]|nr:LysM peptidoglycan-binding domain-containing protein [Methylovulum sp.]MCF7998234.1 LysM peptidoglycan-binding domain-containing protein [Methylovulum sp.]